MLIYTVGCVQVDDFGSQLFLHYSLRIVYHIFIIMASTLFASMFTIIIQINSLISSSLFCNFSWHIVSLPFPSGRLSQQRPHVPMIRSLNFFQQGSVENILGRFGLQVTPEGPSKSGLHDKNIEYSYIIKSPVVESFRNSSKQGSGSLSPHDHGLSTQSPKQGKGMFLSMCLLYEEGIYLSETLRSLPLRFSWSEPGHVPMPQL